jgi:hypothetical protein
MGVSWCIEFCSTVDMPLDGYLRHWRAFSFAGGCDDFVVPIDRTLYRFRRTATGVVVETSPGDAVVQGIGNLSFSGGTYSQFEALFDGFELFVPDHGSFRSAEADDQVWKFKRIMSLDALLELGAGAGLRGELYAAASYAIEHHLLVRVSY